MFEGWEHIPNDEVDPKIKKQVLAEIDIEEYICQEVKIQIKKGNCFTHFRGEVMANYIPEKTLIIKDKKYIYKVIISEIGHQDYGGNGHEDYDTEPDINYYRKEK